MEGVGIAKCLFQLTSQASGLRPSDLVIVYPVPGPQWSTHCVLSPAQDSGHIRVMQPCSRQLHSEEREGQVHVEACHAGKVHVG